MQLCALTGKMFQRFHSATEWSIRFKPLVSAAIIAVTLLLIGPARSEDVGSYRIDVGDVLELSVVGIPELRQRLAVDLNGHIQVLIAGNLRAAGLSLTDLQNTMRDALSSSVYQQRLSDGRNVQVVILRDEVVLRIAEYRPIYLLGDVNKAGEQPYRPGLTVLQAIAMGGGYDIQRFKVSNPLLESADLRGEIDVLRTDLARSQVLVQRLEAELAGAATFTPKPDEVAISPNLLQSIVQTETQQFETRQGDYRNELAFVRRLSEQAETKLATLLEQQRREEDGARADAEEAERLRALVQRGVTNTARAVETRRSSLLSSTRVLQTSVEVEQTRKEKEGLIRRLEQAVTQRRLDLLREFQDASVKLAMIKARLAAASEKVLYTGALRSQLVRGSNGKPEITIMRQAVDGTTRMSGGEETSLRPGDVVEVTLLLDQPGASKR